jgi:hypothetical protein
MADLDKLQAIARDAIVNDVVMPDTYMLYWWFFHTRDKSQDK